MSRDDCRSIDRPVRWATLVGASNVNSLPSFLGNLLCTFIAIDVAVVNETPQLDFLAIQFARLRAVPCKSVPAE